MPEKARYPTRIPKKPPIDAVVADYLQTGERPYIHVCWMLHNHCNHRCSYCDKSNWGGDHPWPTLDSAKYFFEQVFQHYSDRRIVASFTGGEPTLWPDFQALICWLHERKIAVGLTSNGTMGPRYFAELSPKLDWLNLSFHPQFTSPDPFLETLLASAATPHLTIRLMLPPERRLWNRSMDFGAKLKSTPLLKRSIILEHVPIVDGFGSAYTQPVNYEADQLQQFEERPAYVGPDTPKPPHSPISDVHAGKAGPPPTRIPYDLNQLVSSGETNFFGWRCEIGREQLFIDSNGFVLRAGCRVGGIIGHINDDKIAFPSAGVRCIKNFCHCMTDVIVTKTSPKWDLVSSLRDKSDRRAPLRNFLSYGGFILAHSWALVSNALRKMHLLIKAKLPPRLYYTLRDGFRLLARPCKRLYGYAFKLAKFQASS